MYSIHFQHIGHVYIPFPIQHKGSDPIEKKIDDLFE